MGNVFEGDEQYLINARKAVTDLEDAKDELDTLKGNLKKMQRMVTQEEKSINDEVADTIKERKEQIASSYDKQLDVNSAKIRQVQGKKDRKKNQRMQARVANETADVRDEINRIKAKIKTVYKQNGVPRICNTSLYFWLFCPKGADEMLRLLLVLIGACVAFPLVMIYVFNKLVFAPGDHLAADILLWAVIIIGEFIIYFIIFNLTKVRHRDTILEGRKYRDKIRACEKQVDAITNKIYKDKDESVYNLQKYDAKIDALEKDGDNISDQKLAALNQFENNTRQVIEDEIRERRNGKLQNYRTEAEKLENQVASLEDAISKLEMEITDKYEQFLGKKFLDEEKLSDLIAIMEDGSAKTVSGAIKVYMGQDEELLPGICLRRCIPQAL